MTAAAWTMMLVTWAVIIFFTAKFFLSVVRTPERMDDDGD